MTDRPQTITGLQTGYGIGDILLTTGLLRAWKRLFGRRLIVLTRCPELFAHNPDVSMTIQERGYERVIRLLGRPLIWRFGSAINEYRSQKLLHPGYPFPAPGKHLVEWMAESIGLNLLAEERRPYLYLTRREIAQQAWAKNWIAVQSSSSTYWTANKNWVPGRMQAVVDHLLHCGQQVVHLGSSEDQPLAGVCDLRGKTTMRQGAAILANTAFLIGLEGGLMHTARAVETKSIIIYTGYTKPDETGYPENINLRDPAAGDSCWLRTPCPHCLASAENISTALVTNYIDAFLASHK